MWSFLGLFECLIVGSLDCACKFCILLHRLLFMLLYDCIQMLDIIIGLNHELPYMSIRLIYPIL